MSFDVKPGQEKNDQLSLFDYQMPQANFVPSKDDMDHKTWVMAQQPPVQSKATRFVTTSAMLHIAAILSLAFFSVPLVQEPNPETVTIELPDSVPTVEATQGAPVMATQGGQLAEELPAALPEKSAASSNDIVMPAKAEVPPVAALPEKQAPLPPKVEKSVMPPAAKVAAVKSGAVAAKTNFAAVPSVDDLEAPELDKGEYADTKVDSKLDEDLNQQLEKEQEKIAALAAAEAKEHDEQVQAAEKAQAEEAKKLALMQERVRQKNAEAIAAAEESEKAAQAQARDKAAREAAEQEAANQASARAAAQAAAVAAANAQGTGEGQGPAEKEGQGAGNNGDATVAETQAAGEPTGVRSLEQLRQMPGNKRPQYARDERLRGDQGAVVFYAYISKEGTPTQFRMVKSTGFRNLDGKTLVALKKWRFYPGQEGWVELPFRWDLKGGAQEDGGRLRAATN